ncbi:MAG: hypothetical protein E6K46_03505 [Gammaproteobacteria bacterium]|nr:MAG: hypothetical protein E6K46_03505 [Gammaproteobacteria bacterium]
MSKVRVRLLLAVAALAASVGGYWLAQQLDRAGPRLTSGTWLPQPKAVRDFALTDTTGSSFTRASLVGAPSHAFDPAFLGLTGAARSIAPMAADFGVAVDRVELPGGDSTMDHSAVVFLLDARARVVAVFTPPFEASPLAADLRRAAPWL